MLKPCNNPTEQLIREFLALPHEALPSAAWVNTEADHIGTPWDAIRNPASRIGDQARLHADRDGWRDGVTVTL